MTAVRSADMWWKNAIVYCLDVERFQDSNGDGIGDFAGMSSRMEHLAALGVSCIWLMPFYESPRRDDGYDISDYYSVDPRYGSLGDFVEMIRTARSHGIRVIADLVVNHTSDQHPWFQESKSSKTNPKRDWYMWSDEKPDDHAEGVIFPDVEDSRWTRDGRTRQYYQHRFYSHQPDLNIGNAEVREEITRIMGFWMELGLSGFRVDAVPYMMESGKQPEDAEALEPHDYLADLRAFMTRRQGDAIMLGEVNLEYDGLMRFYGEGSEELAMCFDFPGNQSLYVALARQDATAFLERLKSRPIPPRDGQWANFIRNHDELTLNLLSEDEREEVFAAFGPDEDMQIFDRGLRRRLPTMLGGDQERIRMVYSLLYSLPGTPVLFYGEEIGMGENLEVPGRLAVRTPMQWTSEPSAGFSTAEPEELVCPLVEGLFGPDQTNVEAQKDDHGSILSWLTLLIRRRRECAQFGWADPAYLETDDPAVMAHQATVGATTMIAVHNFADRPVEVRIDTQDLDPDTVLHNVLRDSGGLPEDVTLDKDGTLTVMLERYGCRWFSSQ